MTAAAVAEATEEVVVEEQGKLAFKKLLLTCDDQKWWS